jgi:hypothetical protein
MGWKPDHRRIKEKYNPIPNAAEKRHEERMRADPCFGCGRNSGPLHHTRLRFPEKRFEDRDHRYQLPLCNECHAAAHAVREPDWLASIGRTEAEAIAYMLQAWAESELIAQYEGRRYG